MPDWEQQRAIFVNDDEWQRRIRDAILKPSYYEVFHPGNYEFIAHGDPRSKGGVDTIVRGRTIDEKIVRWPRNKDGTPRADGYSAFALEVASCTIPGRERAGWIRTNTVDYLLYCFVSLDEQTLIAYLIPFPKLQEWFTAGVQGMYPLSITDQVNHTACRVVPIMDVAHAIGIKHRIFARPTGEGA